MTLIVSICVAIIFGVSLYLLLGRELKGIAMGAFLLNHAANLSILAMSGTPIRQGEDGETVIKHPPLLSEVTGGASPLDQIVDPLPQALILTAIVIGFGVMGFLLSLIVITGRVTRTIDVDELAREQQPTPSTPTS